MKRFFFGRNRRLLSLLILLCILLFSSLISKDISLPSTSGVSPSPAPNIPSPSPAVLEAYISPAQANLVSVKVIKAVDGDTIEVEFENGKRQKVRYIGIDTPESVDPRKPVQCFAKEATAKNKELVEGSRVGLEKDVSETDRYGRLLRYVYKEDLLVNQLLVTEGYAYAVSYPPDVKYQELFKQAEVKARTENKGLWGTCPIRN